MAWLSWGMTFLHRTNKTLGLLGKSPLTVDKVDSEKTPTPKSKLKQNVKCATHIPDNR
jgi:hypothetical protein